MGRGGRGARGLVSALGRRWVEGEAQQGVRQQCGGRVASGELGPAGRERWLWARLLTIA